MPTTISINRAMSHRAAVMAEALTLCEASRPAISESVKGWGAKGVLDLRKIRSLAKE